MAASLGIRFCLRNCKFCGSLHSQCCISTHVRVSRRRLCTNTAASVAQRKSEKTWQSVVGLEIHAQISSSSKLFSASSTKYGGSTNTQVSFFDAALPGTLPVLNQRCVQAGLLTALALRCHINTVSKFDRKHYFYADLPAGYQITQQRKPLAVNGHVNYVYQCSHTSHVEHRITRLIQLQLEQDSGKSLHDYHQGVSLIDLNRAGVGLMEIVTAPDFVDGDDAASFVRDLRDILLTLGTCDGKMSEGSLRVDANISVNKPGQPLGTRTEVKNLNSFRSIRHAIDYEIGRQIQLLENGEQIETETLSFDVDQGETVPMRDKEKILDYRFMPEPNLPPLVIHIDQSSVRPTLSRVVVLEEVKAMLPELPEQKRKRLEEKYGISLISSLQLVRAGLSDMFETLVSQYSCNPNITSGLLKTSYLSFLDDRGAQVSDSPIREEDLAEIVHIHTRGEISAGSVTTLLKEKADNPNQSCEEIIHALNLWMVTDDAVLTATVDDVLARNPKAVKAYRKGKTNQLEILHTKVVKKLEGKASSSEIHTIIKHKLEGT